VEDEIVQKSFNLRFIFLQTRDETTYGYTGFKRMAEMRTKLGLIVITPSLFLDNQVAFLHQIMDDSLHSPLGDIHLLSDFSHPQIGLTAKKHQYMCMIRKECPVVRHLFTIRCSVDINYANLNILSR
jgi:hypothetical protein